MTDFTIIIVVDFYRFKFLFESSVKEHKILAAMKTGFAACVVQAHNQGSTSWFRSISLLFNSYEVY